MELRLEDLKTIHYRFDSLIEKIDLDNEYEKEQVLVQFTFLRIQPNQLEVAERTANYIIENFSKLYQIAVSTFAYYMELSFPVDGGLEKHSLKDFFELMDGKYDIKCYVTINCEYIKDGLARYSFTVDGQGDFCDYFGDDGLELVMEKDKMIFFDSGNTGEATGVEDYIEEFRD